MIRPPMIILAGGKGARLGDLTKDTPKPMVDVNGLPFLRRLINHYYQQGFRDFIISTGYKSEVIEHYPWHVHFTARFSFVRDLGERPAINYMLSLFDTSGAWIVNGDTLILEELPEDVVNTTILVDPVGVDAGAHYLCQIHPFPIKIRRVSGFIDMGTPEGLEKMRKHFV